MSADFSFLGRIACQQCIDAISCYGCLTYTSRCLSVCGAHGWAVQKRLNRSSCRLGPESRASKKPCITWGSRSDKQIRCRQGWQDDDAAFCQITLNTYFLRVYFLPPSSIFLFYPSHIFSLSLSSAKRPSLIHLGGLWERCMISQRGPWRIPVKNPIFRVFQPEKSSGPTDLNPF